MKLTEYYSEFINAIERTKEWGLNPGEIALDRKGKFLTENSAVELSKLCHNLLLFDVRLANLGRFILNESEPLLSYPRQEILPEYIAQY